MRKMGLILRPMGVSYRSQVSVDPAVWETALASLLMLEIIAERPAQKALARPLHTAARKTPDEVFAAWEAWLTPILNYLNEVLPRTATVVVDAKSDGQTVGIIEKTIPGRCRFR